MLLGKVEEGIEGSPLIFLVHKNVIGTIPIDAANNRHFTHNVLMHQNFLKGCLLFPLLPSLYVAISTSLYLKKNEFNVLASRDFNSLHKMFKTAVPSYSEHNE
jgi:hypothetical protein